MNDQDYERLVGRLEQKHDNELLRIAIESITGADMLEDSIESAVDAVEKHMFENLAWEPVAATDISDIAHEVAERALSQHRAWEG